MRAEDLAALRENVAEIRRTAGALERLTELQIASLAADVTDVTDAATLFRAAFGDTVATAEHASFCRHLLSGMTDSGKITALLPEFTPLGETYDGGDTAYPLNPFTDAAFRKFAAGNPQLRALPQPSFNAACEEVYHGRAHYCILPLRNTEDGILSSFSHLMSKYELKIFRICDVAAEDGDSVIRFALLRRGAIPYVPENGYFKIGAVLPESLPLSAFLSAAETLGACTEQLHTVPSAFARGLTSLAVTFRITPKSMAPLLLFLRTTLEGYTVDGIYEEAKT